ncbi:MAG: cytochrome P450 [Deltaproteobacteria bacterium]|jgi:cytochrome P450|nr:cytochrome P450 [Deltaproteobacteria bacterium]
MSEPNPDPATGRFNLFDAEFARCPQHAYREALKKCPVARNTLTNGPIISRYEDVMWCLRHPEIFSSEISLEMALGTHRPMIPQQIDPPAQTRYRKILDPLFSRKRMNALAPGLRQDANALIDGFIDEGRCEYNSQFAVPLPANAFLHLMGLPPTDLDLFLRLKDGIIRPQTLAEEPDLEEMTRIRKASGQEIYDYFSDLIGVRRRDPRDDLMSYFLAAELDGRKLSDDEILDICFLFIIAGLDTVTATLGCNTVYLATNPDQRRRLVEEPDLMPSAIEELLRWETPVLGIPRIAREDVTIAGYEIKAGEMVTLLLGAANVDDGEFPQPEVVDLARESNRHLAFGGGAHRCLGSHLARMELSVAMEEWHKRIPDYRVAEGEQPRYSAGIREVNYLPLVWTPA